MMKPQKIYKKHKAKPCAQGLALWGFKFVSPVLVLALVLFAFPANTNAAVTIETFNSTPAGGTWTVPSHVTSVDYLVVAGGGGGGNSVAGGGGAGGMRTGTLSVNPGDSLTVTVGAGGAGGTPAYAVGSNGGDSVFATITSTGGGGGAGWMSTASSGGSGGGGQGTGNASSGAGGAGTAGQGSAGGATGGSDSGGGGGGKGATGGAGSASTGGAGGAGTASSISGSSVTYAGGGGGGSRGGTAGSGGAGGGAAGTNGDTVPTAATANTGGGGGGSGFVASPTAGGAGGSGIVIISYTLKITLTGNVQFTSTLNVGGALTKGSGSFGIDHPLDPKNKLLYHSFVESPDVKNIYDGVAKLDKNGEAEIKLPSYFMALNKDFRYQFFAMNEAMSGLYIKTEIKDNKFTIAGGVPKGKISWQVTGIRRDPYILANPIIPEVKKGTGQPVNIGQCIFEPLCK